MCCGLRALGVLSGVPMGDLVLKEEIFLPMLLQTLLPTPPAGDTELRAPALDAPSPSFGKTFVTDLVAQIVEIRKSTRRSRVRPGNLDVLRAVCCESVQAYLANMSWKFPRCCLPDFSAITGPRVTSSDTLAVFPSGRMPCQRVI